MASKDAYESLLETFIVGENMGVAVQTRLQWTYSQTRESKSYLRIDVIHQAHLRRMDETSPTLKQNIILQQ